MRVDTNTLLSLESFTAFDFRALISLLSGSDRPLIARGFEVVGKTGLSINIKVSDAFAINVLDNNGSFYKGESDDADVILDLPAEQNNIFVEARFINQTQAPINTASWNPLALSGDDVAGNEFSSSIDSQNIIVLEISANTIGFTDGAIKLYKCKTNASAVTEIQDARELMFRLATGGVTPDPSHKYPWSVGRDEPVVAGAGVDQALDSSFRNRDSTGVLNDKGIKTFKEWADAVMTRISEVSGSPGAPWYANGINQNYITGLNINTIFFDSDSGHAIMPSKDASIMWSRESDTILRNQGTIPTEWRANYCALAWQLGGTFTSNIPGGSRNYSDVKWATSAVPNGSSVFLVLERDVPKASGNTVLWADNSADPGNLTQNKAVSGIAGDFTGIAIGDFIRKSSEGYSRYYQITKMTDGSTATTTANYVADNSIVGLELAEVIASGFGTEPLRYFRYRYSSSDLVVEPLNTHPYQDINYYWIGKNRDGLLMLRNYGIMQPGEEVNTLEDSFIHGSPGDLILEHQENVVYDGASYLLEGGPGLMLKIHRRKRDNTVKTPGAGDNSNSLMTYTLSLNVSILPGQQLWVKLNDTAGGALTAGSVADNPTDDENNSNTITNVFEILDPADAPLRNFDNKDVFLLARAVTSTSTVNGNQLIFLDGTVLGFRGHFINNKMVVSGDTSFYHNNVRLIQRPEESVLFIDETPGNDNRIDDDVANFFYRKITQIHGVFNYRWGVNTLTLATPNDVDWLTNLGANTLYLGSSTSTIRIRGNLQVDGTTTAVATSNLQVDDKFISLGVGNGLNSSGGSGIEVADDTLFATQYQAYNGQTYTDIDFASAHGYALADEIGVNVTDDVGGITSGEITGSYTVVGSGSVAGDAEIIDSDTIRIWTNQTATSNETKITSGSILCRVFESPSYIMVSDSSGTSAGMSSWSFAVKGQESVQLTPRTGFATVPTAEDSTMASTRIPFVGNDNAGPGGSDSTLEFSGNFTFDKTLDTLEVGGNSNVIADNYSSHNNVDMTFTSSGTGQIAFNTAGAVFTVATARRTGAFNLTPMSTPASPIAGDLYFDDGTYKLRAADNYGFLDLDRGDISGEITGFPNRDDSTFSFVNGTLTFTIQPTGSNFDYYIRGSRYRISGAVNLVIPNTTGNYFIYLDSAGALGYLTSFNTSLLSNYAYVANLYWNATTGEAEFLCEERHGLTMDADTHAYLHTTQGTRYISGLAISPLSALGGDGSTDSQAEFEMNGGVIRDEDISITIVDDPAPSAFFEQILTSIAQIPVAYRSGSNGDWVKDAATNFPLKAGTLRPKFNEYSVGAPGSIAYSPGVGPYTDLSFSDTIASGNDNVWGQSFLTPVSAITVTDIDVYLRAPGGVLPDATLLRVKIYTLSAGVPDTLIGTSDGIAANTITGSYATYNFNFSTPVNLSASTSYGFIIEPDAALTGAIAIRRKSGGGYASGSLLNWDSATWNELAAHDLDTWSVNYTQSNWVATDASADGKYIAMWVFATNSVSEPVIAIMGQNEYADLSTAQSDALYETLDFGTLPFQEFKLLYRLIFKTDSTYANTIKATAEDITDYRKGIDTALSSSYMPSDHGNLTGLTDDDHLQYLLLAGRTSGQTAYGGIAAGNNLVLRSTSHATKGQVWVDESTQSTSSTSGALRVTGGVGIGGNITVAGLTKSQSGIRWEKQISITASTLLTVNDCIVKIDTSANVADINVTLPAADASNIGQVLIIKDVAGAVSTLNKRVFIVPDGTDTILSGDADPLLMDIPYFALILVSDGAGSWLVI